jgi:hypothetical protein
MAAPGGRDETLAREIYSGLDLDQYDHHRYRNIPIVAGEV